MVGQTQVNGSSRDRRHGRKGLGRSIADLTNDVLSLTDLQWQLFVHDCRSSMRRATWALLVALTGAILILCAIPLALLGAARLLAQAGIALPGSILIVAAIAAGIGGLTAYVGSRWLMHSVDSLYNSRTELRSNMAWLKDAIKRAQADRSN